MAYLFREKFNISDLAVLDRQPIKLVLIVEPEDCLRDLYIRHFSDNDFGVAHCVNIEELFEYIKTYNPHLLLINVEIFGQVAHALGLLRRIKKNFGRLPVVTISRGLGTENLKELMAVGICSHIDRRFTTPRDIVAVARTILDSISN